MFVRIQAAEEGDWVRVLLNGEEVFAGHSIGACHLPGILEDIMGYDMVVYETLPVEEM